MLSYSIDPYRREGERCSPIYEELRTQTYVDPRSDRNPYQGVPGYYPYSKRYRRNAERGMKESLMTLNTLKRSSKPNGGTEKFENDSKGSRHYLRRKRSSDNKKAEVETIYFQQT